MGITLDELSYWKEGTLDKYIPSGDYVVVKFARWAFEKFSQAEDKLGTQMQELVEFEERIKKFIGKDLPQDLLIKAKESGFSDKYLAQLLDKTEKEIRTQRLNAGKMEAYEAVPVSGADATYYFSTYNAKDSVSVSTKRKIMILGGGLTVLARA